jgi:1-acyl-sn-glycerol-3-phosphate acyltransferase
VQCRRAGQPPADGFLVANHLSYLDIVVLAALCRCVFVAKQDVRGWPVFGWFAQMAGTIFVDRNRRFDTVRTANEMKSVEQSGRLVVLFPEGTSSGGEDVLPFKSSLLAPVADAGRAVVAHVSYELRDGSVPGEVAYWGDMTLLPHLLNLLTKKEITATVRFQIARVAGADRKTLARHLREQIKNLASTAVEKL